MKKDTATTTRKAEHIQINLERDVSSTLTTGLERIHLIHQALPEINLNDVSISQNLFGKTISSPILISSMTGGTSKTAEINQKLASAAQETGIVMGLGSQRAAIEDTELVDSFKVRKYAPDILLFANIGAVQLNLGYSADTCQKAIDMIEADALILHLNPLQEALQPEGDTQFKDLLVKIEKICRKLTVPVIVKEVGWGISSQCARMLNDIGVTAIDVAGAGGTSWSQVEMYRNDDPYAAETAAVFRDWGITTVDSILNVKENAPEVMIFASGGLRNGLDIAKCLALGAKLGGMAGLFLRAAAIDYDHLLRTIQRLSHEIQICLFATGKQNLHDFDHSVIQINNKVR